jgi:P27 family predicted phage terminase small subunit
MPAHRKATSIKRLAGTERKPRRPNANAAGRLQEPPSPPRGLSKYARLMWKSLAADAVAAGVLNASDMHAFALLVETLETAHLAAAAVKVEGFVVPTSDGGQKKHPAVAVLETARAQAKTLLAEFGLTPRARGAIDATPVSGSRQDEPDNPYTRIRALRGGQAS